MPTQIATTEGARAFDFLLGHWNVRHRKLKERLADCRDWLEFEGTTVLRPIFGGLGNVDENVLHDPAGTYKAVTIRFYNPATNEWAIHWIDGRNPALDPPLFGGFQDGIGTFNGKDHFKGRPIRVRFIWTPVSAGSAQWEQAFSDDEGATWETNWIMHFSRP